MPSMVLAQHYACDFRVQNVSRIQYPDVDRYITLIRTMLQETRPVRRVICSTREPSSHEVLRMQQLTGQHNLYFVSSESPALEDPRPLSFARCGTLAVRFQPVFRYSVGSSAPYHTTETHVRISTSKSIETSI